MTEQASLAAATDGGPQHTMVNTTEDDASTDEQTDRLRWDTLSGFQRDILRALYAVEREKRDLADNAERGCVASYEVRHKLASFPTYTSETADSSRFYPAASRLENRGWLTITPIPGDTRRRQYELSAEARALTETALRTNAALINDACGGGEQSRLVDAANQGGETDD
jgi:hypothetical protein